MKLLLTVFGIAALAGVGWIFARSIEDTREWRAIVAMAEKGFGSVSTEEERRVSDILAKRYMRKEPWGLAWAGLRLQGPGLEERIVLFHGGGSLALPAVVAVPVSVLDGERRDRSQTWILPGSQSRIVALRGPVPEAGVPWSFEMVTTSLQEDGEVRERQVYALLDEGVVLIRREDAGGIPRVNSYRSVYSRVGEEIPPRNADAWEQALNSSEPAELLRTLLWLGGIHELPTGTESNEEEESAISRQAHVDILGRPGVLKRVAELRDHPHPWVAQAAAQVEISD